MEKGWQDALTWNDSIWLRVINNTKGCSDRIIRKQIVARQRLNPSAFKEVGVYEKGKIRPILINKQSVENNRGA